VLLPARSFSHFLFHFYCSLLQDLSCGNLKSSEWEMILETSGLDSHYHEDDIQNAWEQLWGLPYEEIGDDEAEEAEEVLDALNRDNDDGVGIHTYSKTFPRGTTHRHALRSSPGLKKKKKKKKRVKRDPLSKDDEEEAEKEEAEEEGVVVVESKSSKNSRRTVSQKPYRCTLYGCDKTYTHRR
jgi:hypothetical protein